jgi:hypothetical protein
LHRLARACNRNAFDQYEVFMTNIDITRATFARVCKVLNKTVGIEHRIMRHHWRRQGNIAMTSDVIPGLEARLALAEAVAREAGAVALDYFKRRETLVVETKRDQQDVVSIADREVET